MQNVPKQQLTSNEEQNKDLMDQHIGFTLPPRQV